MPNYKRFEQWQDMVARLYPELCQDDGSGIKKLSRTVTFQTTDACNLCCKYCYQINKGHRSMSFETAKKVIDMLLSADESNTYINPTISPGLIIEFIGGEPFLEIDLMDQIVDYFKQQAIEKMHPWATLYCISICSNGILYSDPKVQRFLNKNRNHLSFSITIDGNKELHDSCRVFPDGSPSYDIAIAGAMDWIAKGNYMGSKITIAPGNINYLYDAIIHMIELGYDEINANCVYEKGWEPEHATELYYQMKHIADYLLENNKEYIFCSLFEESFFHAKDEEDLENWCFRADTQILTPDGNKPIEQLKEGDEVISGIGKIQKITSIATRIAENTVVLKIDELNDTYTTFEHPYWSESHNGWIQAGKLTPHDRIAVYNADAGNALFVWRNVRAVESTSPYEVYNLTVENDHSFIANGAIVHNCGGNAKMLAIDPDGYYYPCLRYMESSLGEDQTPLRIGHVDTGLMSTPEEKQRVKCLECVNRRTQSTDECFYCPIAEGCSW